MHPTSLFEPSMSALTPPSERPRFLSEADCRDLVRRLARVAKGGGYTSVHIVSTWTGNVRWARNQISTAGEVCENEIDVVRSMNGARGSVKINETTDAALVAAARQAERIALLLKEHPQTDLIPRLPLEPRDMPQLFSEATYQLNADQRADAAIALARRAQEVGMLSAGYIEVMARSVALLDTYGRTLYFPYTQAQCSVTVREPKGAGSGWAGADHYDWGKIDGGKLTTIALDKCLKSQNPVRIEPGRYTVIMEPQAVADFVGALISPPQMVIDPMVMAVNIYETNAGPGPFNKTIRPPKYSLLGEKVADERITVSADPMDPEMGFPPFAEHWYSNGDDQFTVPVFHKVTWIDKGILTNLAYDRSNAISKGLNTGLPNSGAFRMSGGTTSQEEMIATTKRGILITRCDQLFLGDWTSQLYRGVTRDGLWLIENGKISKSIKNLVFTESIRFALNKVEQLGIPQRVFHPGIGHISPQPMIVPPLKIQEFSFTALTDAV